MSAAAVAENPAMDSSLQKTDGKSKGSAGGGVGNGAVGRLTTARYEYGFGPFALSVGIVLDRAFAFRRKKCFEC